MSWSATCDLPHVCVPKSVAAQASRHPDSIAITLGANGIPIPNAGIYLLGENFEAVPDGPIGEIY